MMEFIRTLRRETRKSKFIILSVISIVLFVIIIMGNVKKVYNSILEFDNQLTDNSISLSFDGKLSSHEILDRISAIEKNKDIIVRFGSNVFDYDSNYIGDFNSEGIYFSGSFNNGYDLLSGRFFNINDFTDNKNLVVIGKDILRYTKIEDGKRYLINGDTKFEVIGVIGKSDISSMYDDKIIYNLKYIFDNQYFVTNNLWTVDSVTLSKKQLKEIVSNVDNNITIQDSLIGKSPNPLKIAIKESKNLIIGILGIIFCAIVTLVTALYNWLDCIKMEVGIRKCNGAENKNIIYIILRRYLIYAFFSFFSALLIYYLCHIINLGGLFDYRIDFLNILICIASIVIIGIMTIAISVYSISKIEISKLLRGR